LEPNKLLTKYSWLTPSCNKIPRKTYCGSCPRFFYNPEALQAPLVSNTGLEYYQVVSPLDEAFAFFCMKHYQDILDFAKVKLEKNNHTEADEEEEEEKMKKKAIKARQENPSYLEKLQQSVRIWQLAP